MIGSRVIAHIRYCTHMQFYYKILSPDKPQGFTIS